MHRPRPYVKRFLVEMTSSWNTGNLERISKNLSMVPQLPPPSSWAGQHSKDELQGVAKSQKLATKDRDQDKLKPARVGKDVEDREPFERQRA